MRLRGVLAAAVVGMVGIAFLSALIPYCPCPEMRATKAAEHECCAPATGLRAALGDCCAHHGDANATAASPRLFSAPALTAATVAVADVVAIEAHAWPSVLRPSFSPSPPLILRI